MRHFVVFQVMFVASFALAHATEALMGSVPIEQKASTSKNIDAQDRKTLNVNGVLFNLDVEINAGVAGDKTLAHGIYLFHLKCSSDISCGLDRISLNECSKTRSNKMGFYPKIDSWSTWAGRMEVKQLSSNEIELIVYQAFEHKLPAKVILTFESREPFFKRLTDFKTSGFIDLQSWPNIDVPIEYAPIQIDRWKSLDCPLLLHGLNK